MVFDDFLRSLTILQNFFGETGFISQIQAFANVAANAKSGSQPNWREALLARFEEIDNLITTFEGAYNVIIDENAVLQLSPLGGLVTDYANKVEHIFEDIITADTQIQEYANSLNVLRTSTEQMLQAFSSLDVRAPERSIEPDLDVATFEFRHQADITNLKDLGKSTSELDRHIKALARLDATKLPKDIQIVTLSKSSPFTLKALIAGQVAKVINTIISDALDNAKKVQELRMMEQTIKSMKLDNEDKKAQNSLSEVRASLEKQVIQKITDDLVATHPKETKNGSRNEVAKGVHDAVEYFVTQTSKGLEVKILPSSVDLQEPEKGRDLIKKYRAQTKEISALRQFLPDGTKTAKPKDDETEEQV